MWRLVVASGVRRGHVCFVQPNGLVSASEVHVEDDRNDNTNVNSTETQCDVWFRLRATSHLPTDSSTELVAIVGYKAALGIEEHNTQHDIAIRMGFNITTTKSNTTVLVYSARNDHDDDDDDEVEEDQPLRLLFSSRNEATFTNTNHVISLCDGDIIVFSSDLSDYVLPPRMLGTRYGDATNAANREFGRMPNTLAITIQKVTVASQLVDTPDLIPKVFFTNVSRQLRADLSRRLTHAGFHVSANHGAQYEDGCTHLVLPTLDINAKVVTALAAGCDIVSVDWCHDILTKVSGPGCRHLDVMPPSNDELAILSQSSTGSKGNSRHIALPIDDKHFSCCTLLCETPFMPLPHQDVRSLDTPFILCPCLPSPPVVPQKPTNMDHKTMEEYERKKTMYEVLMKKIRATSFEPSIKRRFLFKGCSFAIATEEIAKSVQPILSLAGASNERVEVIKMDQTSFDETRDEHLGALIRVLEQCAERIVKEDNNRVLYFISSLTDTVMDSVKEYCNKLQNKSIEIIHISPNMIADQILSPESNVIELPRLTTIEELPKFKEENVIKNASSSISDADRDKFQEQLPKPKSRTKRVSSKIENDNVDIDNLNAVVDPTPTRKLIAVGKGRTRTLVEDPEGMVDLVMSTVNDIRRTKRKHETEAMDHVNIVETRRKRIIDSVLAEKTDSLSSTAGSSASDAVGHIVDIFGEGGVIVPDNNPSGSAMIKVSNLVTNPSTKSALDSKTGVEVRKTRCGTNTRRDNNDADTTATLQNNNSKRNVKPFVKARRR